MFWLRSVEIGFNRGRYDTCNQSITIKKHLNYLWSRRFCTVICFELLSHDVSHSNLCKIYLSFAPRSVIKPQNIWFHMTFKKSPLHKSCNELKIHSLNKKGKNLSIYKLIKYLTSNPKENTFPLYRFTPLVFELRSFLLQLENEVGECSIHYLRLRTIFRHTRRHYPD